MHKKPKKNNIVLVETFWDTTPDREPNCVLAADILRGFGTYTVWGCYTSCMLRHRVERSSARFSRTYMLTFHSKFILHVTQKDYKSTHSLPLYICITSVTLYTYCICFIQHVYMFIFLNIPCSIPKTLKKASCVHVFTLQGSRMGHIAVQRTCKGEGGGGGGGGEPFRYQTKIGSVYAPVLARNIICIPTNQMKWMHS